MTTHNEKIVLSKPVAVGYNKVKNCQDDNLTLGKHGYELFLESDVLNGSRIRCYKQSPI